MSSITNAHVREKCLTGKIMRPIGGGCNAVQQLYAYNAQRIFAIGLSVSGLAGPPP